MGMDITILEKSNTSITIKVNISEPLLTSYEFGNRSLFLPRWSNASVGYDSSSQNIIPRFSIPILLPPTGDLPNIQVLDTQLRADNRLSNLKILPDGLAETHGFLPMHPDQLMELTTTEDFKMYKTGRVMIFPYALNGQRLVEMTFRLDFPAGVPPGKVRSPELLQAYVNTSMAQNWAQAPQAKLGRTASALPQGRWYQIPINSMGIQRIKVASFVGAVPNSDPRTWQVFAPYFEGKSLPFRLSLDPTPDNLKSITTSGEGLADGVFSGEDALLFFAQALNGDFKGNNFTHLYGRQRYYWLCIPDNGSFTTNELTLESASLLSPTQTIVNYEKRLYHESELHNQLHSGQTWVGEKLTGSTDQFTISFHEDYLDMSAEIKFNARLVLDYDSGNFRDTVRVTLNGLSFNVTQNTSWGQKHITINGTAVGMLQEGNNSLGLNYTSSSNSSIIYLDSLRLAYHRQLAPSADYLFGTVTLPGSVNRLVFADLPTDFHLWDITDPSAVTEWQIENDQFTSTANGKREVIGFTSDQVIDVILSETMDLGSGQLRQAEQQVDYIIITPEIFMDQAERIRELREELVSVDERLEVMVVPLETIYNEFSAGTQDPAAIKHFLHQVYLFWDKPQLKYVLLLGDTDYDYRNITGQSKMMIPTYQKDGLSDISSYPTDDRYTYIASGIWDALPDFAIGRLPAQTPDQLEIMIDKIIDYELNPEPGIWRNTITLVADDPMRPNSNEPIHINDTERLSRIFPLSSHVNKIYLTEYPEVQDPNSPYIKKPKARDDFIKKLYNGTLLVNYLGHGSPNVWAQEEVFTVSDLGLVKTDSRLPFWVAGTCDWAKYDDINSSCVPEELMLMQNNGAVGILSTTRKTYATPNSALLSVFFNHLFPEDDASRSITVGEAIMLAKNIAETSDVNNEKYILFCDPALKLASPVRKGQIESLNPTILQAMGRVTYTGRTDTSLATTARAAVTVYDTPNPVTRSYVKNSIGSIGHISYILPGKRIFRGLISVNGTDFSGDFILPKDIKYSGEGGILRVQYWDDTGLDGSIFLDTLMFRGTDSTALDDNGPEILFLSENLVLLNGDHFSANDALEIELSDDQGINLTGAAGHGISLAVDENWDNAYDVTELFEYDLDHSDLGRLSAYLSEIPPGEHLISVKAWDSQNNPNEASVRLEFFAANDFRIYDLFNYPNPMIDETEVTYLLSHPAQVEYAIYTLAGRKIISEALGYQSQGFNTFPWDGRDRFGDRLANGVYILFLQADSDEFSEATQSLQKLVIAR